MKKVISILNKNYNEFIIMSFPQKLTLLLLTGILILLFKISVYGIHIDNGYIKADVINHEFDVNITNRYLEVYPR